MPFFVGVLYVSLSNRLSIAPFQEIEEMKTIMDKDR